MNEFLLYKQTYLAFLDIWKIVLGIGTVCLQCFIFNYPKIFAFLSLTVTKSFPMFILSNYSINIKLAHLKEAKWTDLATITIINMRRFGKYQCALYRTKLSSHTGKLGNIKGMCFILECKAHGFVYRSD